MFRAVSRLVHTSVRRAAMDLRSLVGHLESIAPSSQAESWDNVGLLVEPSGNPTISCILLTIDLTELVLNEARELGAGLVISYHPLIFHPLKRLTQQSVKERIVIRAVESGVAVYSPHTALDCMEGGVNDWLLAGLGEGKVQALTVYTQPSTTDRLLTVFGVQKEKIGSLGLSGAATIKPSPRYIYIYVMSKTRGDCILCHVMTVTHNSMTSSGHAQRKMWHPSSCIYTTLFHPVTSLFSRLHRWCCSTSVGVVQPNVIMVYVSLHTDSSDWSWPNTDFTPTN